MGCFQMHAKLRGNMYQQAAFQFWCSMSRKHFAQTAITCTCSCKIIGRGAYNYALGAYVIGTTS